MDQVGPRGTHFNQPSKLYLEKKLRLFPRWGVLLDPKPNTWFQGHEK